jgi:FKBP-type peptidyl-prolyl cis-trans isomerase
MSENIKDQKKPSKIKKNDQKIIKEASSISKSESEFNDHAIDSGETMIKITKPKLSKKIIQEITENKILNANANVSPTVEDQLNDDYTIPENLSKTNPASKLDNVSKSKVKENNDLVYTKNEKTNPNKLVFKLILLIAIFILVFYIATKPNSNTSPNSQNLVSGNSIDKKQCVNNNLKMEIPTNLKIEDTLVGTGKEVFSGCEIKIHYKGYLVQTQQEIDEKIEPKEFDNSFKRGAPFSTQIGVGKLIKGWDIGIIGMKEGGKRKLTIPAELAYGDIELPGIPAKSTLVFEVELIQVID